MKELKVMQLISQKKKTMHILHLILSIFTGFLWVIPWIIISISNSNENRKIDKRIDALMANDYKNV